MAKSELRRIKVLSWHGDVAAKAALLKTKGVEVDAEWPAIKFAHRRAK